MKKLTFASGTLFALCLLFTCTSLSYSQCFSSAIPAAAACSGGNGALASNANVNSGQTYYYSGSGTLGNVNLNGGTIRVCGTLTLNSSFNFNSGRIIVESSGTLTINKSMNLNGNCSIINRGLTTINGSLTLQNSNNYIINSGSSAIFLMNSTGTRLELNSSTAYFGNEGVADIYELRIQSQAAAGSVCLGQNSCTQTQYINNNRPGAVTAGGHKAALSVSQNIYLNQPITNDTALAICMRPGSSKGGPAAYGTPKIFTDCPSCSFALPVTLSSFSAEAQDRNVVLQWSTASESNNAYFSVERSSDNLHWEEIAILSGQGNSNQTVQYSYTDEGLTPGTWYYRLRQTDFNGQFEVFAPLSVLLQYGSNNAFTVYPVPFGNELNIQFEADGELHTVEILNGMGQVINTIQVNNGNTQLNMSALSPGFYFVRSGTQTLKVIKQG